MIAIVLDTETTGLTAKDEIIQLAYYPVEFKTVQTVTPITIYSSLSRVFNQKYRPSVPINPHAAKVNGVQYLDLLGCPASKTVEVPKAEYVVGHNISFDMRMIKQCVDFELHSQVEGIKTICTKELASKLDKKLGIGFPNHKLDTLVEFFYPEWYKGLSAIHDALDDCYKTELVLCKLLEYIPAVDNFDKLYEFLQSLKKKK